VSIQLIGKRQATLPNWLPWILVPIFVFIGIGLRFAGRKFLSIDMHLFLLDWYDQLAKNGFSALREPFSNYTPPYLYLLFLVTKTAGLISKVSAIKLLSTCFDFLDAFWVYKILKIRFPQGAMAAVGASGFLLLPTVVLNSAYWGQADAIYTFFILACIYFLMKERPLLAMIFLGISFAFKAQAAFLAPLIFLLVLKKKIPWFYIVIIPVIYVLMMIPAALAGRSLVDLLKIYISQAETYPELSLHAPNLYLFFPSHVHSPALVLIGLLITAIVALAWIWVSMEKIHAITPPVILLCALTSVAFMPFFLPKMHERYFYLADVLSFLMAFYFSRGWLLAVGYQLVSGLPYALFLLSSLMRIKPVVAGNVLISAMFINIALMGFIFSNQWKLTNAIAENRSVTVS
jgi:Gpi18-like mannosyltransferase